MMMCVSKLLATFYVVTHLTFPAYGTSVINLSSNDYYVALKNDIMNRPAVKHKIPLDVSNDKVINMLYYPFQIKYVDEIHQLVGVASLMSLSWKFKDLSWNPDDYNGHNLLEIDKDLIWTPTISTPKQRNDGFLTLPSKLKLTPDGITAEIPILMESICDLNLSDFPFDSHNCTIQYIEMNAYNLVPCSFAKLTIKLEDFFGTNTEWMLLDSSCYIVESENITFFYTECWVTFKRESVFYLANILIPLLLMATMTLCVFCIPAESGEKISFIVSLFVSMAVFVNFVVDNVPRSMTQIPRLVYLILAMMIKLILGTLASALVLQRYYAEQKEEHERVDSNLPETEDDERLTQELPSANDKDSKPNEQLNAVHDCDAGKYGKERRVISNVSQRISNWGFTFRMKSNKVDIDINSERNGSTAVKSKLSTPKSNKDGNDKSISWNLWKISHSQLDKLFFVIFLTASSLVYFCIICL